MYISVSPGIFSFENFNPALGIFPAVVTVDYSSPNIFRGLNTKARMVYLSALLYRTAIFGLGVC